jgi:opacity protein-like surface antigen
MKCFLNPRSLPLWIVTLTFLFIGIPKAQAQWTAGVGYQYRGDNPNQGVKVKLRHPFGAVGSHFEVFARTHVGYFFLQEESFTGIDGGATATSRSYDVGLGGGVEANIARFRPYIGIGSGYERHRGERRSWSLYFSPKTSDIDVGSLYFSLYAGMSIEAFSGTMLYVEGQLPEYLNEQKLIDIGLANAPVLETGVRIQF